MRHLPSVRTDKSQDAIASKLIASSLQAICDTDLKSYFESAEAAESAFSDRLNRVVKCFSTLGRQLTDFEFRILDSSLFQGPTGTTRARYHVEFRENYSQGKECFQTRGFREYLIEFHDSKGGCAGAHVVDLAEFSDIPTPEPVDLPTIVREIRSADFSDLGQGIGHSDHSFATEDADWVWNGAACRAYSDRHAISRNSSYRDYDNDCTNFASQCLEAGGKAYRDGDRQDKKYWFYGSLQITTSYSWAGAQNLAAHLLDHTNSGNPTRISDMRIGDIVFYDRDTSGPYSMNHAMVVAERVAGPDLLLNYHTNDTYRKSLLQIQAENPNLRWVFVTVGNKYT
jgi:hypothetical protein